MLEFGEHGPGTAFAHVADTLIDVLIDYRARDKALRLLRQRRRLEFGQDAIDAAISARRPGDYRVVH